MQCVQFETRLNELLDERLSPELEPEIQWHADQCAACAALLAAHESLLAGVEALRAPASQPDLAVRVAAEVSRMPTTIPRNWNWWLPAVAAAVLLGVGVWHWTATSKDALGHNLPSNPNSVAVHNNDASAPAPRSRFVSVWIARDTEKLTEDFSVQPRLMMEQVVDGIKPVTDSMSAALNALRRNWPTNEPGSRSS